MIVTKTRRLVARMGQYESHEVVAQVQLDTDNVPPDYSGPVTSYIDNVLDELVASDVEEAHLNTSDEDSFIHPYHEAISRRSK